jgi:hypothetical protein
MGVTAWQDVRDCVLCSSCKGKDEMERYLICPFGFQAISCKFRLDPFPNGAARFMLVDLRRYDDTVLMALALYGVRGTVHKFQAQQYRAEPSSTELSQESLRNTSGKKYESLQLIMQESVGDSSLYGQMLHKSYS